MQFDYKPTKPPTYFEKFEIKLKVRKNNSVSHYLAKMTAASVATAYVTRKIIISNEIKKLEKDNYFNESEYDGCLLLNKDVDFKSASAAAAIVKNRATNGQTEWKTSTGLSLSKYLLDE